MHSIGTLRVSVSDLPDVALCSRCVGKGEESIAIANERMTMSKAANTRPLEKRSKTRSDFSTIETFL